MNRAFIFTVLTEPIAQPRHQITRWGGKYLKLSKKMKARGLKEHPVIPYKQAIVLAAKEAGVIPLSGPVIMNLVFILTRPKKYLAQKYPDGTFPHIGRPDKDNLEKACADALKGIAWHDDSQIYFGSQVKLYASRTGENSQAQVKILIEGED